MSGRQMLVFDRMTGSDIATGEARPPEESRSSGLRGVTIPDYALLRAIGSGAYGEVWLARSTATGALRAVKIVRRSTFTENRPFEREFEGLLKFEGLSRSHPSQLAIFHVGRDEAAGYFYYVMELADPAPETKNPGGVDPVSVEIGTTQSSSLSAANPLSADYRPRTLRSDLAAGRLPAERVLEIAYNLVEALDQLHTHGLVHRDIKPSNIIYAQGRAKLADIGLVTDSTDIGSIVGTEGYLPPEGPGTPAADLFALGKVLYEALTGFDRRRFPELPIDMRQWPDARLAFELNAVLVRASAANSRERYPSTAALGAELERLRAGKSIRSRRTFIRAAKAVFISGGLLALAGISIQYFRTRSTGTTLGTKDTLARNYYTQGLFLGSQGRVEEMKQYFERSVQQDPQFAEAWVGLAGGRRIYSEIARHGPNVAYSSALAAIEEAKKIKPSLTSALAFLAETKTDYGYDQREAERLYRQILAADPKNPRYLRGLASTLVLLHQTHEAVALARQALRDTPTGIWHWNEVGIILYSVRQYDEAAEVLKKGLEFYPNNSELCEILQMVYESAGKTNLSADTVLKAMTLEGRSPNDIDEMRSGLDLHGLAYFWRTRMDLTRRQTNYVAPVWAAVECVGAGEYDRALEWLEKLPAEPYGFARLPVIPNLDPLRSHPRFQALLRQLTEKQAAAERSHNSGR